MDCLSGAAVRTDAESSRRWPAARGPRAAATHGGADAGAMLGVAGGGAATVTSSCLLGSCRVSRRVFGSGVRASGEMVQVSISINLRKTGPTYSISSSSCLDSRCWSNTYGRLYRTRGN